MFFKYFSRQILFSMTFQDSPVNSSTFQACVNLAVAMVPNLRQSLRALPVVYKILSTSFTFVRLFTVVYPHVVMEMFAAHKSLAANITYIRLRTPVDHHVLVTERRRCEMFVTHSAFEWFLPFMNPENNRNKHE